MLTSARRPASSRVALWGGGLALAGVVFLMGLGAAPLIDRDEPAYAEAAREMLERGDWLSPWFNGRPWFDKPPLVYWSVMASYRALGVSEAAARLPVALFGLAGLLAVYWIGRRLRSPRAGALAAGVLATSLLYLGLSRVVLMDVPFTFFFTVAMGALVAGIQEPRRARWPLLAGAALGLAILAKSPSACALFAAVLLAAGLASRSRPRARGLRWGYAALACIAAAAPWYAAMTVRYGSGFLIGGIAAGNLGRFLHAEHARSVTPFYYLPIIILGFLPWTALLPGSLRTAWRAPKEGLVPLLWAILTFGFFSASQSKLPGYIRPIFPALALMAGLDMDRVVERRGLAESRRGPWYAAASTLVVFAILCIWGRAQAAGSLWGAWFLVCLAMLPLGAVIWIRGRPGMAAAWTCAFGVAAAGIVAYVLLPAVAQRYTAKELALRIQADGRPHRIYLVNVSPLDVPSLLFYCRQTATELTSQGTPNAEPGDMFVVEAKAVPKWPGARSLRAVASAEGLTLWTSRHGNVHNNDGSR